MLECLRNISRSHVSQEHNACKIAGDCFELKRYQIFPSRVVSESRFNAHYTWNSQTDFIRRFVNNKTVFWRNLKNLLPKIPPQKHYFRDDSSRLSLQLLLCINGSFHKQSTRKRRNDYRCNAEIEVITNESIAVFQSLHENRHDTDDRKAKRHQRQADKDDREPSQTLSRDRLLSRKHASKCATRQAHSY